MKIENVKRCSLIVSMLRVIANIFHSSLKVINSAVDVAVLFEQHVYSTITPICDERLCSDSN